MQGCCTRRTPWTSRVGGLPAFGDDRLVYTPGFPCGETGEADEVEMRPIAGPWSGCVGEDCDGDLVLVQGHVQSVQRIVPAGRVPPFDIGSCEGYTAQPRLKLGIETCGFPGPVFIDSDSHIIIPAGETTIGLWGPPQWNELLPSTPPTTPGEFIGATVKVTACPCRCGYTPSGTLTTWITYSSLSTQASRTMIRPRRAVSLAVATVDAASNTANAIIEMWIGDPNIAGAVLVGAHTMQAGFPLKIPEWGAITHLVIRPALAVALHRSTLRWEIE